MWFDVYHDEEGHVHMYVTGYQPTKPLVRVGRAYLTFDGEPEAIIKLQTGELDAEGN